jgi:hypothetical protein
MIRRKMDQEDIIIVINVYVTNNKIHEIKN